MIKSAFLTSIVASLFLLFQPNITAMNTLTRMFNYCAHHEIVTKTVSAIKTLSPIFNACAQHKLVTATVFAGAALVYAWKKGYLSRISKVSTQKPTLVATSPHAASKAPVRRQMAFALCQGLGTVPRISQNSPLQVLRSNIIQRIASIIDQQKTTIVFKTHFPWRIVRLIYDNKKILDLPPVDQDTRQRTYTFSMPNESVTIKIMANALEQNKKPEVFNMLNLTAEQVKRTRKIVVDLPGHNFHCQVLDGNNALIAQEQLVTGLE